MAKSMRQLVKEAGFVYHGFGFPVVLMGIPILIVRGVPTPDVRLNALEQEVLMLLAEKRSRLTGAEVRFIRHANNLTLQAFAERFGVTHPAVIKWEKAGRKPSGMTWSTEKDIRLFVLERRKAKPAEFVAVYRSLEKPPVARQRTLTVDASHVA